MRIRFRAFLITLLGLAALPCLAGEDLGRLFMTPEQRRALDVLRETGGDVLTDAGSLESPVAAPLDRQVVLNGVVRRSLGPDVVWVNGSRTHGSDGRIRVRRGPDRSSRVTLEDAADGSTVRLKPGQFWEPATGRVANCYGCSTVTAEPAATAEPLVPAPTAEDTADKP